MFKYISDYIVQNNIVKQKDRLIVGFSGGPDSVCLLYFLNSIKEKYELDVALAYLNHELRGKESEQEESFVDEIAKKFKLKLYKKSLAIKDKKGNLEANARKERYGFFVESALDFKADKIALAHNKDDHVETVLMNIIRGAGIKGVSGISVCSDMSKEFLDKEEKIKLKIIRPLLCVEKEKIKHYLDEDKIEYITDSSNFNKDFTRNNLRLDLIPLLENQYNNKIKDNLVSLAGIANSYYKYIEFKLEDILKDIVVIKKNEYLINKNELLNLEFILQTELIRKMVLKLAGTLDGFEQDNITEIFKIINSFKANAEILLPNNIMMKKEYDDLIFLETKKNKEIKYNEKLKLSGEIKIKELGYIFKTEILSAKEIKTYVVDNKNIIYCDLDKVRGDIVVRNKKDGDSFIPFGMSGFKKVKNVFIDNKVSMNNRAIVPVLQDDEKIIWVAGLYMDNRVKCDDKTKRVLRIVFK
jgi:tRNA(Ile)-lysidine synthase